MEKTPIQKQFEDIAKEILTEMHRKVKSSAYNPTEKVRAIKEGREQLQELKGTYGCLLSEPIVEGEFSEVLGLEFK